MSGGVDCRTSARLNFHARFARRRKKSPVRSEDRARELVRRFIETAGESRELLVSLIERVELTEEKEIIIKFRFREPEAVS